MPTPRTAATQAATVSAATLSVVLALVLALALLLAGQTAAPTPARAEVPDASVASSTRAGAAATLTVGPVTFDEEGWAHAVATGTVPGGRRELLIQRRWTGVTSWWREGPDLSRRSGEFTIPFATFVEGDVLEVKVFAPRKKKRGLPKLYTPTVTIEFDTDPGSSSPPTTPTAPGNEQFEDQVVALVNAERAEAGCAPLVEDARLGAAARGHSADMAVNDYFSHDSPDGRDLGERIEQAGYTGWSTAGENIAMGYATPADVMAGWMSSAGHRSNILDCSFEDIGVGLAYATDGTPYWTQDFGAQ